MIYFCWYEPTLESANQRGRKRDWMPRYILLEVEKHTQVQTLTERKWGRGALATNVPWLYTYGKTLESVFEGAVVRSTTFTRLDLDSPVHMLAETVACGGCLLGEEP